MAKAPVLPVVTPVPASSSLAEAKPVDQLAEWYAKWLGKFVRAVQPRTKEKAIGRVIRSRFPPHLLVNFPMADGSMEQFHLDPAQVEIVE